MADFSIITSSLPLLMMMASCFCATYRFGATIGGESHLNLTSTGYGTLKSNNTENTGIGGVWKGTVYGGGYGNYDNIHDNASASKVVSLTPGDSLKDIKSNDTTYTGRFFFVNLAKRFSEFFFGPDNSVTTTDAPTTTISLAPTE